MAGITELEREHSNYENELGGVLVIEVSLLPRESGDCNDDKA
jgi:hypothetical protein